MSSMTLREPCPGDHLGISCCLWSLLLFVFYSFTRIIDGNRLLGVGSGREGTESFCWNFLSRNPALRWTYWLGRWG